MRKTRTISSILLFSFITMLFSSCATLFSGTQDKILINTTPPNADVYVDGELKGKSGQEITLRRKHTKKRVVVLKLEGYDDVSFGMDQKIAKAYFLNIPLMLAGIIPGVVGVMIDAHKQSIWKPKQTEFNQVLMPKK
ncbi:MAG: PEGA domain-containing protein [Bacteroidetes bacterium]|nr:PEGA domain-containing protein [Bacteroidota bacterium]